MLCSCPKCRKPKTQKEIDAAVEEFSKIYDAVKELLDKADEQNI